MKTVWKIVVKILLIAMLATILLPIGWLAWRAGQPMEMPQFKGYTYYEYLAWRKSALGQMAVEYKAAHPNAKMGGGLDACYNVDTIGTLLLGLPLNGFYTLAGVFPKLEKYVTPRDQQHIPQDVTLWTFMPSWWKTYEEYVWYIADSSVHTSVSYCRLAGTPPTPISTSP